MLSKSTPHTVNDAQMSKSLDDDLNLVTQNFIIYLPLIFLIFGFIGFIGNLFTYLQAELRSNTCCIYLLCGSIIDIIILFVNLFPNYLASKYQIYIQWYASLGLCKLNIFLLGFLPHLSISFLLMSTIDRFASSCGLGSPMRRLNQLKMVPWTIAVTVIFSCLASIRGPILYDSMAGGRCQSSQPTINSILYIVLNGLMQPLMMFVFILLTHRNIRRSRQRVGGVNILNHRRQRNQFVIMVFSQVVATSFFSLQWSIMYMYYSITMSNTQTSQQVAIIWFVFNLTNTCFYLNNVKSFYLSMLSSQLFRKTLTKGLIELLPRHIRPRVRAIETNFPMAIIARNNGDSVPRH